MQYTREALQDIDNWYSKTMLLRTQMFANAGYMSKHQANILIGKLHEFTPELHKITTGMRTSHKFLFPRNFYNHVKSFESIIPLIRMPFKSVTIEFEADLKEITSSNELFNLSKETKFIVQLIETQTGIDIYSCYIHDAIDDEEYNAYAHAPKHWSLIEAMAHYEYGSTISEMTVTPFEFGIVWSDCVAQMAEGRDLACISSEQSYAIYQKFLRYLSEKALIGLAFLNLRNSETINIPMTPMQRSRSLNKPYPYFSYNICSIFAGIEVLKCKPSERTKLAERMFKRNESRLHMVRGHFKHRKTGIYWWSSFLRGSEQLGLVAKDYQVK